jgi:tetratricopeptide (TPR) repeat protein
VVARTLSSRFQQFALATAVTLLLLSGSAWAAPSKKVETDAASVACQQGKQLLLQGQAKAAEEAYRSAVKAYPQSLLALSGLASCLLAQNKAYAALDQVNRMLALAAPLASQSGLKPGSATMPLTAWLVSAKVYLATIPICKLLRRVMSASSMWLWLGLFARK